VRVLITGSGGYIGTVLHSVLTGRGHDVVGVDTNFFADCVLGPEPGKTTDLVRDIRSLTADDIAGFDGVVHLAAVSNDPMGDLNPQATYDINHTASVTLAEAAKTAGVPRFVFFSSCSLYGAGAGDLLDESAEMHPVTPYGESKVLAERDLFALADDGFVPVSLRNATAYGFSPRLRSDIVINDLVAQAVTTGRIVLASDGSPWRPLVHIRDIAAAAVATLEAAPEVVFREAFNIVPVGENYTVAQVAKLVGEAVEGSEVSIGEGAGPDLRNYRVNGSKFAGVFPGALTWTVPQGIVELRDAYRAYSIGEDDIRTRYSRLAQIKRLQAEGRIDDLLRPIA
jgi:nucleoside-diphosphate-sugar epimerase